MTPAFPLHSGSERAVLIVAPVSSTPKSRLKFWYSDKPFFHSASDQLLSATPGSCLQNRSGQSATKP